MAETTQKTDYSVAQKMVHWLMALVIMFDLFVAQKFGDVMTEADRFESRSDHATVGTVVALLLLIRIYLRWKHGVPVLPETMPNWQKQLAHLAHWGLYILILGLVTTGILSAMNASSVVAPFGLFTYGDGTGDAATFLFIRGLHEFATNAIIALIAVHIVAALYHGIFVRDGVTSAMLKFWKSERT